MSLLLGPLSLDPLVKLVAVAGRNGRIPFPDGQSELFPHYRHHGVFTDSPLTMLQAETSHRGHAFIEQVNADLKSGAPRSSPIYG